MKNENLQLAYIDSKFIASFIAKTGFENILDKSNRVYLGIHDLDTGWFIPLRANLPKRAPRQGVFPTPFKTDNQHFKNPGLDFQYALYISNEDDVKFIANELPVEQANYIVAQKYNIEKRFTEYVEWVTNLDSSRPQYINSAIPVQPDGIQALRNTIDMEKNDMNSIDNNNRPLNEKFLKEQGFLVNEDRLQVIQQAREEREEWGESGYDLPLIGAGGVGHQAQLEDEYHVRGIKVVMDGDSIGAKPSVYDFEGEELVEKWRTEDFEAYKWTLLRETLTDKTDKSKWGLGAISLPKQRVQDLFDVAEVELRGVSKKALAVAHLVEQIEHVEKQTNHKFSLDDKIQIIDEFTSSRDLNSNEFAEVIAITAPLFKDISYLEYVNRGLTYNDYRYDFSAIEHEIGTNNGNFSNLIHDRNEAHVPGQSTPRYKIGKPLTAQGEQTLVEFVENRNIFAQLAKKFIENDGNAVIDLGDNHYGHYEIGVNKNPFSEWNGHLTVFRSTEKTKNIEHIQSLTHFQVANPNHNYQLETNFSAEGMTKAFIDLNYEHNMQFEPKNFNLTFPAAENKFFEPIVDHLENLRTRLHTSAEALVITSPRNLFDEAKADFLEYNPEFHEREETGRPFSNQELAPHINEWMNWSDADAQFIRDNLYEQDVYVAYHNNGEYWGRDMESVDVDSPEMHAYIELKRLVPTKEYETVAAARYTVDHQFDSDFKPDKEHYLVFQAGVFQELVLNDLDYAAHYVSANLAESIEGISDAGGTSRGKYDIAMDFIESEDGSHHEATLMLIDQHNPEKEWTELGVVVEIDNEFDQMTESEFEDFEEKVYNTLSDRDWVMDERNADIRDLMTTVVAMYESPTSPQQTFEPDGPAF